MANNMKIPLHDYQIFAKNFMITHPYCGLFLNMGLGKTSIVLEALWELNPHHHVLIVAPKTIAKCTWINEINKWKMPLRTQSLIVNENGKDLSKKKREEIYKNIPSSPSTIYFINREMIADLIKHFPGPAWCFQTVIIDESQSFKSSSSKRFKALKSVRPYISRMTLLTGSPTPKGPEDLWAQIYLLDMGARLGRTLTKYRETYFNPGLIVDNHPVNWIAKEGAEDIIYQKVSDLVISMKNNHLKLPPLTFNDMYAEMDKTEIKRYKAFKKDYVLDLSNGDQIEACNAAVLSAKLSQMASGAIYLGTGMHEFETIHKHKLELCKYIIENTDDCILVAYHFHSDKEMLMSYLTENGIDAQIFDGSPVMERAWNNKQIPVMLIQPASSGFGLNLQDGGSTLIWYTLPWSLEQYEQTNARIYRQGQTKPVIIHRLMTKNTIDTKIIHALETKSITQQNLLNAIEAELNS